MTESTDTTIAAAAAERARVFDAFITTAQKAETGSVFRLDDETVADVEVIPTGIISLDVALGVGGLPRGRIVEIYGTPSGGKSALAIQVCAMAQSTGGFVGYIDAEHAFDPRWAETAFGVDAHRFAIAQPNNGTEAFQMAAKMCESGAFDVVVIDSVTALVPPERAEAEFGEANRLGQHARMMSEGLNWLTPIVSRSRAVVIFVNQIRMNPGAYGNPETTTGGKALGFYASVRIEVRSSAGRRINASGGVPVGQECAAKVVKNKVAPPHRTASWELYYDAGISTEGALLEVAEKMGVVERKGASYTDVTTGERIGVGKENVKTLLAAEPELAARLQEQVYARLRGDEPLQELSPAEPDVVLADAGSPPPPDVVLGADDPDLDAAPDD